MLKHCVRVQAVFSGVCCACEFVPRWEKAVAQSVRPVLMCGAIRAAQLGSYCAMPQHTLEITSRDEMG